MMNKITCPNCKEEFEISQVLVKQLEGEILAEERKRFEEKLREAKKVSEENLQKKLGLLEKENKKKEKQLREAQAFELAVRKEKNKLEEEKKFFELEKQRQLDKEREKIREKAISEIEEKNRLKERENQQKIESLKKSLEEAQRKASQGSQQLQGEVLELDIEETLKASFPKDNIEPIAKGVLGADVRQTVLSPMGKNCGVILWESKRTKSWSDSWITKLKSDMLKDKAHISSIVSQALPKEAKNGMGYKNGVWIVKPELIYVLAKLLRNRLLDVAKQKKIAQNSKSKSEALYSYITSHEFQHQVQAMIEVYIDMKSQIDKERISFERSWKRREQQIQGLLNGVSGMYGSMQGIAGSTLPTIKGLSLDENPEEELKLIE